MKARPYQGEAVESCLDVFQSQGVRSALLLLPTGCGKTVVAGLLGAAFKAEKRRLLFLAHRDELVNQAAKTFEAFGLKVYVEQADRKALRQIASDGHPDIVVGSIATMKGKRLEKWPVDYFSGIITDEAHHAVAKSYRTIYAHFADAWHLGVTATGDRGDKKNLGRVFERIAYKYTITQAVKDGWLVPVLHRKVPIAIDLKGITVRGGDYDIGALEERIGPKIEPMCRAVAEMVGSDPFVCFTPDVGSASAAASIYQQLGIDAVYVAGDGGRFGMDKEVRRARMKAFDDGKHQALICCQLLDEGWDSWRVKHVVIKRPTRQRNTLVQRVGRGTRPVKGLVDPIEAAEERRRAIATSEKPMVTVIDFDWEADAETRALDISIDLFDDSDFHYGSDAKDVMAAMLAAKRKEKEGQEIDEGELELFDMKDEADEVIKVRQELNVKIKGFKLPYRIVETDPFLIGSLVGAKLSKKPVDSKYNPPSSENQRRFLRDLGHPNPDRLSRGDAGRLITALKERKDKGLAHPMLVDKLVFVGVDKEIARELTHVEAKARIKELRNDPDLKERFQEYNRMATEAGRFDKGPSRKPEPKPVASGSREPSFLEWLERQK